jgi:flavin-dependent dehydrogenase
MTGAYLYRRLKNEGCEVHIFDRERREGCGLKPCAWGTSADFIGLMERTGLLPGKYILRRFDHVLMDDVRISADLITFDKPQLVKDLLGDAEIRLAPLPTHDYDRVIDATGIERALLPPIDDDIVLGCCQYLIRTEEEQRNRIKLGGIGYAWCFPLSGNLYHVGCGTLCADPKHAIEKLGWLASDPPHHEKSVLCSCTGKIRLTGPYQSQPFISNGCKEGIWGVGEAIGCVAPLAGDGIVPGMRSVQLLLDTWDKPKQYREALLDEFRWMKDERGVVDILRKGGRMGLREALVLRKNSKRMGMRVGLRHALRFLKNLGE